MASKRGERYILASKFIWNFLCALKLVWSKNILPLFSSIPWDKIGIFAAAYFWVHVCYFQTKKFLLTLNGKHVANKTARLIQYIDIWLISRWVMVELLSPALVELGEGSMLAPFYPAYHWSQNFNKPIKLWKQVQRIK